MNNFTGKKSVGASYLIWLFFGFIGFHRFYLGKVGTGVLYLLTFGLLGMGWLWDLFAIPSYVRNHNDMRRKELGL